MPYAKTRVGEVVHFPGQLETDEAGVIIPPTDEILESIAASIADSWLLRFSTQLLRATKRHRAAPRHARLNVARVELARKCVARTGDVLRAEAAQ